MTSISTTSSAPETDPEGASPGKARRSDIEVLILCFNEAPNIAEAVRSVNGWADRVVVVDSGSTDGSQEIAREHGAEVIEQPWLGYAKQKNWGLANAGLSSAWTLILDADESITPELRDELLAIAAKPSGEVPEAGFYLNRLTRFMGQPIRHCGWYPSYNLRFFKRGTARYEEREVHEHMVVNGPTSRLRHHMLHEDRRGLEHFIAKHNRYSTLESREIMRELFKRQADVATQLERGIAMRRWLKNNVLPRLPVSGLWRFMYMYGLRLGFLDGLAGFRFCLVIAMYDTMINLKLAELRSMGVERHPDLLDKPVSRGLAVPEGTVAPLESAARAVESTSASSVAPALTDARSPSPNGLVAPVARAVPQAVPSELRAGERPRPDVRDPRTDAFVAELRPSEPAPGAWPAVRSVRVSVLIPVKNEQRNIAHCLRRLQWADELVVVDSQSVDPTIPMSQAMGADVYQFYYSKEGWPKKKNWALENVPWRNEWVLILDADEYMTPELAEEIRRVVTGTYTAPDPKTAGCGDGYWLNRRFMFMGRWIKGCGYYPSWNVRLFKHAVGRYERIGNLGDTSSGDNEVHEHVTLSTGAAGYLEHEFLHYAYPDLSAWIEKHNRYTTWEAHAMEARDEGSVRASLFGSPIERRRWLKSTARRLPFRPTLRFLFSYIFQRGFMDGYPGFVMCRLLAWYELVSLAKHREMKSRNRPAR